LHVTSAPIRGFSAFDVSVMQRLNSQLDSFLCKKISADIMGVLIESTFLTDIIKSMNNTCDNI
jgi:hypothetical protein